MMQSTPRFFIFFLLVAMLPTGCARPPAIAEEEPPPAPVKAVAVQRMALGGWTELLGATQPLPGRVARISTAVEGHVVSLFGDSQGQPVAEGQNVAKGQVILRLDDRIARANREKVLALIDELALQKKEAASAVEIAQLDVERLEKLAPAGSSGAGIPLVSRIELAKARIALEDAKTKQQLPVAKERGLRAELEVLNAQLDFYQLRAPIAGRLGTVQAVPGQTLAVGAAVAEVIDLNEIDVLCLAPPAAAARLALDQPAWVMSGNEEPGAHAGPAGKVVYIAVQAQSETGNFAVKVRFPNPNLRLRANAVLRVEVLTDPEKERLSVPVAALLEDQDPPLVVAVENLTEHEHDGHADKIGKVRNLRVQIGVRDRVHGQVEILGLEDPQKKTKVAPEGLLFVIQGGHGLHDGDAVKLEADEDKEKTE